MGGNPARFCDKEACPSGSACLNGVAAPLMTWHSPAACKSESADAPYIVEIDESTAYPNFGKLFKVNAHTSMDTSAYKIEFSVVGWPGPAPAGCGASRANTGVTPKPGGNWLTVQTDSGAKPSGYTGAMGTSKALNAEDCTTMQR